MARVGQTTVAIRVDYREVERLLRRLRWRFQETSRRIDAERAEAHADWFCSLPWYRRWLAMVMGR